MSQYTATYIYQAQEAYQNNNYGLAIQCYEKAIELGSEEESNYLYLGLILLLDGQEEAATSTWLYLLLSEGDSTAESNQRKLLEILEKEASYQEGSSNFTQATVLRKQIQEIDFNISNFLSLLQLNCHSKQYQLADLNHQEFIDVVQKAPTLLDQEQLVNVLEILVAEEPKADITLDLLRSSISSLGDFELRNKLAKAIFVSSMNLAYFGGHPDYAACLCEIARALDPSEVEFTGRLAAFYQDSNQYEKGIQAAKEYLNCVDNLIDRIHANKILLKGYSITGGHWSNVLESLNEHYQLLARVQTIQDLDLNPVQNSRLVNACFFNPYYRDSPKENRALQNSIAKLCQNQFEMHLREKINRYQAGHFDRLRHRTKTRKLRIGFLSFCLRRHSVGWLARSLFEHQNWEKFDFYAYLVQGNTSADKLQDWYCSRVKKAVRSNKAVALAKAIFEDEIDVLIELDSLTTDTINDVIMLKPAPVQATWLGWDASGLPTIDYFVADAYVLPQDAQSYYQERIVRLPNSYIAMDGFEVGIPSLRRSLLNIPPDAVVFYSVQKGYKRNPDIMRLQLQIIAQVSDSYFCIKGASVNQDLQLAVLQLADEVGVDHDRLKFIADDALEITHRANMQVLADIVLDTYPYNGATTTMETLWLGIPLVTRVGEQFSARNSYTMLKNVGVEAGIAYSAEEYVEWGVRLGTDHQLRQQVARQLQQSRRHAPLWNGRQFARDMEQAYEQMWADYVERLQAEQTIE
ncbi:MAG: O-linked N-acetylglucosamine transferase, SPINDLY family protein [Spirulina sp. SIO3F2]|nr:O-linked N-acetylglucosamine transferase, SPINDLY family protein [Spirulina sp. SIO3F2]